VPGAFARALKLPLIGADVLSQGKLALADASPSFLRQARILPLSDVDGDDGAEPGSPIRLAMADPSDTYTANAIALFSGSPVTRLVALPTDLDAALDRLFPAESDAERLDAEDAPVNGGHLGSSELDRLREAASDAPVIRLVNSLLGRAVDERASDLHAEPTADGLTVRLRVDGRLRVVAPPVPVRLRDAVVSRVKLMAGLDIAERRLPQDGRIAHAVRGQEIDFRVATTPTAFGERALSHELNLAPRNLEVLVRAQAAVAARHVRSASSRRTRSVRREVRWRWTLNVLWTAA
jgi:general secretion pathway protein E